MFDKEAYWRDRKNTEIMPEDEAAGYPIVAWVVSEVKEPANTMPDRYDSRKAAKAVIKAMPRRRRSKFFIQVEVRRPLSNRTAPKITKKKSGDKHFDSGHHVIQMGNTLGVVSRKVARTQVRKPTDRSERVWPYPPQMTNKERMEHRRDQRKAKAEKKEVVNAKA